MTSRSRRKSAQAAGCVIFGGVAALSDRPTQMVLRAPRNRGIFCAWVCPARLATFSRDWELSEPRWIDAHNLMEATMNGLIYLVGLVVVILAVLSFFGLR